MATSPCMPSGLSTLSSSFHRSVTMYSVSAGTLLRHCTQPPVNHASSHIYTLLYKQAYQPLYSNAETWIHSFIIPTLSLTLTKTYTQQHTHTRLMTLCLWLPRWAGTRNVKPIWILLKQETVSSSGINWAICKSASRSRQITTPAPHHSVFYRPDALPAAQPTASKHWRKPLTQTKNETKTDIWKKTHSLFLTIFFCEVIES